MKHVTRRQILAAGGAILSSAAVARHAAALSPQARSALLGPRRGPYPLAWRQIANRCDVPSLSLGAAVAGGQTTRTKHRYYGKVPTRVLKVGFANFWLNGGVTGETLNTDAGTTVQCAIEGLSTSSYTDFLFSGSSTLALGTSDFGFSDGVDIGFWLYPGDDFWLRTLYTAPANGILMQSVRNTPIGGNPAGFNDEWTLGGNFLHGGEPALSSNKGGGSGYWPCAVLAPSEWPAFAHIGDSKGWGQQELAQADGLSGDRGWCSKYISRLGYGHLRLSKAGDKAQNVAGVNGRPKSFQLMRAAGVTELWVPLGINDIAFGQTRAQTIASLKAIATRGKDPAQGGVSRCFTNTVEPRCSQVVVNSDWSLANQTVYSGTWVGDPEWAGMNDDIRGFTLANSGFDGKVEVADLVTPGRGVCRWNDAIAAIPGASTLDGVHELNGTVHGYIASQLPAPIF